MLAVVYSEQVQERFAGLGYLAVFVITIVAAATVILPAPGAVSVAAFGAVLNPWLVGLVAATGQTIGELSGYYIGWSGRGVVQNVRGYAAIKRWMDRHGVATLFVLAMIPNPVFDVAGMIAGASRFGVVKFIAASWPGRAIKNTGFAFAGALGIELLGVFGSLGGSQPPGASAAAPASPSSASAATRRFSSSYAKRPMAARNSSTTRNPMPASKPVISRIVRSPFPPRFAYVPEYIAARRHPRHRP